MVKGRIYMKQLAWLSTDLINDGVNNDGFNKERV